MTGTNLVVLVGHVGNRPELRSTASGKSVLNFSVGVNDEWVDENQQRRERCEWAQIAIFGKAALTLSRFLAQGHLVSVVGRMRTETFEHRGETRHSTKIVADRVQVLTPKSSAEARPPKANGPQGVLDALERATPNEFTGDSFDEEAP